MREGERARNQQHEHEPFKKRVAALFPRALAYLAVDASASSQRRVFVGHTGGVIAAAGA